MNKKIIIRIISILLIAILVILISRFFFGPAPEQQAPISIKEQKELFENFDVFINDNPLSDRLSFEDFQNGFWYKTKSGSSEDIFFFNVPWMVKKGMSQEYILNLIHQLLQDAVIVKKEKMVLSKHEDLPEDLQFHNDLYGSILEGNYNDIKNTILNKENKTAQDYIRLSEIFGIEGDYEEKDRYLKIACNLDTTLRSCDTGSIVISGEVTDHLGKNLAGVEIKVISDLEKTSVLSADDGSYSLEIKISPLHKNRVSFSKNGYATTFHGFTITTADREDYLMPEMVLYEGVNSFLINNIEKTVSADGIYDNGYYIIKTKYSKYSIPEDAFYLNDQIYKGEINAYLYDFDRTTVPDSLLSLDVFSPVAGFVGTSMLSFGMPYIVFQTNDGQIIHVKNSNPMTLEYQSPILLNDLAAFQNNDYFIKEVDEIINITKDNEDLLTRSYLREHRILFPPYWILDQETGVWENVPFQVLNRTGLYKMKIYTTMK